MDKPVLDKLAKQVKSGSIAFLKEEYKYLGIFVVCLGGVLTLLYAVNPVREDEWNDGLRMGGSFIIGALLSAVAGWCGMMVATDGNVRTTVACKEGSLNQGLRVAFTAGSVMGFTVVGLGMFGLGITFWLIQIDRRPAETMQLMAGFGFGASA